MSEHETSAATPRQGAPWRRWGTDIDQAALDQMARACQLPVALTGALMPDAHVGYGLPIGGVLATDGAVIPYAVGVDIACRMRLTAFDLPLDAIESDVARLTQAIELETRFGVGAAFAQRREHAVMDEDWSISPVTRAMRDRAWAQLGTSGSGNHFVEFGALTIDDPAVGLGPGSYLALLSHSGSRGTGAQVCAHYSKLAAARRRGLPRDMVHLAWLDLDSADGGEYWAAMELMGRYAAANHALIHSHIARRLGAQPLLEIENHHNFAWKEAHEIRGRLREVVVHRKGATPAGPGALGIIPGSMASPAYVVRGRGNRESLHSAAHGAGRRMSRKRARETLSWAHATARLRAARVKVLSAGIDELPMVYKDIDEVMAAQAALVEVFARFEPRLVKMCPAGHRPED